MHHALGIHLLDAPELTSPQPSINP